MVFITRFVCGCARFVRSLYREEKRLLLDFGRGHLQDSYIQVINNWSNNIDESENITRRHKQHIMDSELGRSLSLIEIVFCVLDSDESFKS